MTRLRAFATVTALVLSCLSPLVFAQDTGSIAVRGAVVTPGRWSPSDVKRDLAEQIQAVKFATRDKVQHSATGIPLVALILKAGAKTEPTVKHPELRLMVAVEARDGYRVLFSLGELLPAVGHADAFLVWEVDGKSLAAEEGPFRLIVTSDRDPDRHIYGISTITLIDSTGVWNPGPRAERILDIGRR